ncbi:MAG: TDT family transporter [Parvimonas sp.]|uniref:TDT family transporter n=1 Tax=Parvimonas sp. TaxID=1944660 RepID=UPI0025E775ED|nr:TDT family transporter [Parvimonas sp.]MCI5997030.1 TDT family transporter [Parvimonas sp.]MDY3050495.1 TDT family transporter [Parvimonas sp.]
MAFLKKLPIPIAGLILSMFALGNLLQSYSLTIRLCIGAIAGVLYVIYVLKVMVLNVKLKEQFNNPIIASVFLTITMATMLISTYLKPYSQICANIIWFFGFIGHSLLIIWFSMKFLANFSIKKVFPSWYIVYVGIATASVTAPAVQQTVLGQYAFWFAFISYIILLPFICYRVFKVKEVPEPAKPTFVILCAPASLLLAGYMNSFATKSLAMSVLLFIFSTVFYLIVLVNIPKLLKLKFSPGFSAFTFPLVITALATKLFNGYLIKLNGSVNYILKVLVNFEEIIAVIFVLYVFIGYMKLLFSNEK